MAEEKKKKQQMAFLIGGAVVVAGLGYLYYSSQKKSDATETNNDTPDDSNKIEQITYAGDNEEEITESNKEIEDPQYESKDNEASLNNDQVPDENETKENQGSIDIDTGSAKKPEQEPEKDKETEEAIKEEEPKKEEQEPKEESPVIVEKEKDDEAVVVNKAEEPPKPSKEEIAAAEKKIQEEKKLNRLIERYQKIADGVSKMKKFRYKNGKIKVKVLRATNVDDKDPGMNKKNVSDALVKLTITNSKDHPKTSFKKDQTNPIWNESFELSVKDALREILTCELEDHDTLSNDTIGTVTIPVIDVVASKNSCVKNREFKVKGSKTGCKLYLDLEYVEDNKSTGKKK